jgi:hypothetical protein
VLYPEIGSSSIDCTQLSRLLPEEGERVQSPKRLKKRMMDNVQKVNICTNIQLSQTFDLKTYNRGGRGREKKQVTEIEHNMNYQQ